MFFKSRKKPSDPTTPLKPALRSVGLPFFSPSPRPMAPAPAPIRRSESSSRHADGYMSATTNTHYHRASKADPLVSKTRPASQMGWQQPPPQAPPVAQRTRTSSKSRHVSAPPAPPSQPHAPPAQERVSSRHHRPPVMSTRLRTESTPAQPPQTQLKSILKPAVARPQEIIELAGKGKDAGYWSDGPLKTKGCEVEKRSHPSKTLPRGLVAEIIPLRKEMITLQKFLVARATFKPNRAPPLMYFDLGFYPFDPKCKNIRVQSSSGTWRVMNRSEYSAPASPHCEITKMDIICQGLSPWPVRVRNPNGITVKDVFLAIYDSYRVLLTEEEREVFYDQLHSRHFLDAYRQRCQDSVDAGECGGLTLDYQLKRGPMRIDMLMGKRIFNGLKQTGNTEWDMMVHGQWWESKDYGRTIQPKANYDPNSRK